MRHLRICSVVLALVLLPIVVNAGPPPGGGGSPGSRDFDNDTMIDANDIGMVLTNYGVWGRMMGAVAGTFYPIGTDRTCMYVAGLWVAGLVGGSPRAVIGEYQAEYGPGVILGGGGWADPTLPRYRVYKLTSASGPGDPDYDEWPVEDGAPVGEDGTPLKVSEQTLWSVFNDANPYYHTGVAGSTLPIGVEVSHLTYAYNLSGPLRRVILHDFRLLHKGEDRLIPTYVGIFMDSDLGGSLDDLAGCDSLLGLVYTYNADNWDDVYEDDLPAVGIAVLDGPGPQGQPLWAARDYRNGDDPRGAEQSLNLLRGLTVDGDFVYDPTTGEPTRYSHAGDPIQGTGWVDEQMSDKRNLLSSGPFIFSPGDEESLRVALIVGDGGDRIDSVRDLKDIARCLGRLQAKGAFPVPSRWGIAGFYPQPFELSTGGEGSIFVLAPEDGMGVVQVFDEAGGLVRSFGAVDVEGGLTPISWDGRDDGGALVTPGRYRFFLHVLKPVISANHLITDSEWVEAIAAQAIAAAEAGPARKEAPRLRLPAIAREGGWIELVGETGARWSGARSFAIHDVSGRMVRDVEISTEGRGAWWNGMDNAGRRLPAGIYLVRARELAVKPARTVLLWE